MGAEQKKIVAQNKKAFHDYFVLDRFEAGIELCGTEVKSQAGSVLRDTDEITGFPVTLTRQRVIESPTPYKVNSRKLPQKPRADDIRPHGYNIR